MADVHSKSVRSYNMSRIKGKNTKPELIVRRFLHSAGLRYRLHSKHLPGKPDIILKKYRTVIFVNGCFWHGHRGCRYFVIPKTRTGFWVEKIGRTAKKDKENMKALQQEGWHVIVIWECQLKKEDIDDTLKKLEQEIRKLAPVT